MAGRFGFSPWTLGSDDKIRCALELAEKVESMILESPPGLRSLNPNLSRQLSTH